MFTDPQLQALAAVHRRGSFETAASMLGLTPSAISQRIKALEDRVGTLLIRRGQPCEATPAGLRLIRHHDEVALLEQALARDLPGPAPGPMTLRIAVNADSLATWLIPALAAVEGILFDVVIDDQEHSQDLLRRGEVAAAVTSHPGPLQGCDTIRLGALRYRATASPAFLARWMTKGPTAEAMATAPALIFSNKDRLQTLWAERQTGQRIDFPAHRLASTHAFVDAALAGLGWCMNPEVLVADHIAQGRLAELAPDSPLDTPLFWQFSRLTSQAIAPVTRAIRTAASRFLIRPD
jgi:LysR family transcriptional regulator (chromosome initiation inhibitor)